MTTFLGSDLWSSIRRVASQEGRKCAAIAYYSSGAGVSFGAGDTVIVDASEGSIRGGQTSARLLLDALDRGAEIFSHPLLHAKMIIGPHEAVVSSANLSARSGNLREAGVHIDNPSEVAAALLYFRMLQEEASPLTRAALELLVALPVSRRRPNGSGKPSLLEGLASNMREVDDVAWGYYGSGGVVSKQDVVKAATARNVPLPKGWTWFESVKERGLISRIRTSCRPRPAVHFWTELDSESEIVRFCSLETFARNLVEALPVDDAIVSIFGPRGSVTPFDLSRDAEPLVKILNRGLEQSSIALSRRINSALGVIASADLHELFVLGSSNSDAA